MLGSLFLAWLEHDEMDDSCDELELGGVHNVGDEDPDTDQSLLSGDEVGMTCKSNATVSVSNLNASRSFLRWITGNRSAMSSCCTYFKSSFDSKSEL